LFLGSGCFLSGSFTLSFFLLGSLDGLESLGLSFFFSLDAFSLKSSSFSVGSFLIFLSSLSSQLSLLISKLLDLEITCLFLSFRFSSSFLGGLL
jgi:hypothetical protein